MASVQWTMAERSFPLFRGTCHASLQVAVGVMSVDCVAAPDCVCCELMFCWTAFDVSVFILFKAGGTFVRLVFIAARVRTTCAVQTTVSLHTCTVFLQQTYVADLNAAPSATFINMTSSPIYRRMLISCTASDNQCSLLACAL